MIKNLLPRGLVTRTLLILILPVFIIQGFGIYLFYERHWDKLAQRLSTSVAGEISLIAEWYEDDASFLDTAQRIRLRRYMDIDATPGAEVQRAKKAEKATYSYLQTALTDMLDGRSFAMYNPAGKNLTVVVQTERGPINLEVPKRRLYSSTTYIFVLWLVGLTILLLTISAVFLKRQMKPILRLATAALGQGRMSDVPLKLEGADEVRQATAAFMDMQERIKHDREQRNALMQNVREDLQKPIERLKLMLETVLPDHPDTPGMIADVRAMERLIDNYLAYVRDNKDEPLQLVSLGTLLEEAKRMSGVKRLQIDFRNDGNLTFMARSLAMTRAMTIIIRNAATLGADLLVVEARQIHTDDGQMVLICLEDNGRGLDEKTMKEALRPLDHFQEGKAAQGFGLALAAGIIDSHDGSFELSKGLKGLRLTIILPV